VEQFEEDEDWCLFWTDTAVGLEQVIRMKKFQVRVCFGAGVMWEVVRDSAHAHMYIHTGIYIYMYIYTGT
jgi:hypothetical protein